MPVIPFDHLTREERLTLIGELIDSLHDDVLPLPAEHREELERRLASLEEDMASCVSWEDVRAEMLRH